MATNIAQHVESSLRPATEPAWRRGFANLLRQENRRWWGTRRGLVQSLIWLILVNTVVAFMLWVLPWSERMQGTPMPAKAVVAGVINILGSTLGLFGAMGVAIIAQSAIVGEKQLGTAAWILSKPVVRGSMILSKLVAYTMAIIVTMIMFPGATAFAQIAFVSGGSLAVAPFLAGVAVLGLHLLFYLCLTLLLGTLVDGRGPVIAVPLSLLFLQQMIGSILGPVRLVLPGTLIDLAQMMILRQPLPATWAVPVAATAAWSIVCVAVAIWRFGRDEF